MTKAVDVETIEKNSKQNTVGKISPAKKKIALKNTDEKQDIDRFEKEKSLSEITRLLLREYGIRKSRAAIREVIDTPHELIGPKEAVNATLKGEKICIPTRTYKLIVFLLKLLPHSLFSLFSGRLAPGRYDKK